MSVGRVGDEALAAMGPGSRLVLVTKSDSAQAVPLLALRVQVPEADAPATLVIRPRGGGVNVTLTFPVGGVYIEPWQVSHVLSTGSTANAVVHGIPAA